MRNLSPKGSLSSAIARASLSIFLLMSAVATRAQATWPINIQGRITVEGTTFTGVGKFKFALVKSTDGPVLWTHDGTSAATAPFEPTGSIDVNVAKGLYSILLGDTTIVGMTKPITADIFTNADVRLRIWFNDGARGFQRLTPDQRVGASGYAFNAQRSDVAASLTGTIKLEQVPATLVTNNATAVNLTGTFSGDGSGLVGIRGSAPWQIASAATNDAFPNTGYVVTNLSETVILLPATASVRIGDVVRVAGANAGSWKISQRDGQSIYAAGFRGGPAALWTPRDVPRNWTGICAANDFSRMAAVVYGNGPIMLSTNSGSSWYLPALPPTRNWRAIACSADGMRMIAGAEGNQIFISEDGGESWTGRSQPGNRSWYSVACSADGTNMVAVPLNGPLYVSSNAGADWAAPVLAGTKAWVSVACSRDGRSIIAAVSGERLYTSKDLGVNWLGLGAGVRLWTAVASSADGLKLAATVDNGNIYTSTDGGTNWIARPNAGLRHWASITSSADGNKLAAAVAAGQIYVSLDGGASWTPRDSNRAWYSIICSPDGSKFAATENAGRIYISDSPSIRFTTTGPTGYLQGDEYSAVELQHVGGGRFMPLSSAGTIVAF
jgi:hypothetical protein